MNLLQLLSSYRETRSLISREKHEIQGMVDVNPGFDDAELQECLRSRRLSRLATNCSYAIEGIGIPLGEQLDPQMIEIMENLSHREKVIFRKRFEKKSSFFQIAADLEISVRDAETVFNRVIRKLSKYLRDSE